MRRKTTPRKTFEEKSFGEMPTFIRKKSCRFCRDPQMRIDYKDAKALRPFISEREKITPSRYTGMCAYHQRKVTEAIKRARILAIIPFSSSQKQAI